MIATSDRAALASLPPTATLREVRTVVGDRGRTATPGDERPASLEAFGLAATELQRINIELFAPGSGERGFWNAGDLAAGALEEGLRGLVPMASGTAATLARAAERLLAAGECMEAEWLMTVDALVAEPGAGTLTRWWIVPHEPAVEVSALAEIAQTAGAAGAESELAAAVHALVAAVAELGGIFNGRIQIRTFGRP